jgi:hypothetical protein
MASCVNTVCHDVWLSFLVSSLRFFAALRRIGLTVSWVLFPEQARHRAWHISINLCCNSYCLTMSTSTSFKMAVGSLSSMLSRSWWSDLDLIINMIICLHIVCKDLSSAMVLNQMSISYQRQSLISGNLLLLMNKPCLLMMVINIY